MIILVLNIYCGGHGQFKYSQGVIGCEDKIRREKYVRESVRREKDMRNK